ncbi:MAG: radical SAM protein, partial [candidate division Zixibacteria bacterium]|nr:radical SAM protein [candidate division Zixibacteria bacterium]
RIIDLNVESRDYRTLPYSDFDLVGISVDTMRYPISLKIAEAAKRQKRLVVGGGQHVTFFDSETLSTGLFDFVVRREGEYTMLDLVKHIEEGDSFEEVKGISFLSDGELIRTPSRPLIDDLDSIPFPARDLLPLQNYTITLKDRFMTAALTSRGCPFNCEFCAASQFFGRKWRTRSIENVMEEIELLYEKYGYRAVAFFDDNFTLNPKRMVEFCENILKNNWNFYWWAFSRLDSVVKNEELVKLMARAGLKQVFIGFESGSQEVLDGYGKDLNVDSAFKAMEILKKYKITVWASFIIGALNETKKMIKQTIKFANRLNPRYIQFGILTPYPGTTLYEKVKNRLLTTNWEKFWGGDPVIKLDKLSSKELKKLFRRAHLSFYGRPKRLLSTVLPFFLETLRDNRKNGKIPLKNNVD